jgi:hypothetical protein
MGDNLKRYIVSFESYDGKRTSYSVVVRNGRDKAIALAAAQYTNSHPERDPFRVSVQELGTPEQNPDGTPMMDGDELVDRYEW